MGQKIRSDKKLILLSDLPKIEAFAAMGVPVGKIATIFGMTRETFYQRIAEMPEIALTIERGKANDLSHLLAKSKSMAMGPSRDPNKPDGDSGMVKWRMAVIHGITKNLLEGELDGTDWDAYSLEELENKLREIRERNECTLQTIHAENES